MFIAFQGKQNSSSDSHFVVRLFFFFKSYISLYDQHKCKLLKANKTYDINLKANHECIPSLNSSVMMVRVEVETLYVEFCCGYAGVMIGMR